MRLVDTHCHLDVSDFDSDREEVLRRCHAGGIEKIVVPAIEQAGWQNLLRLCRQYPGLYPALGMHPVFIHRHQPAHLALLEKYIAESSPVAVGEIGLDFYLKNLDRERQLAFFEAQLEIAKASDLPVLLHVRKAHEQVLNLLKKIRVKGGISHAFNGSAQQAQQYIDMGFKLGFGGTMTYEGSKKIRQLATHLPLEAIVLETDAPDMVVAQHRGERNSPEYLLHSLAALAALRGLSLETVAAQTRQNAHDVLDLDAA
ncbi:MAG: TatD family hydrolase [Gammaproteobacteria bacterium]